MPRGLVDLTLFVVQRIHAPKGPRILGGALLHRLPRWLGAIAEAAGVAQDLGGSSAAGRSELAHTWIACTDADTRVPRHWLTGQLESAESGVDVVTGAMAPDRGNGTGPVQLDGGN